MKRTFIPNIAKLIMKSAYESKAEINLMAIARDNQIFSYSSILKYLKLLERNKLATSRLKARKRYVRLTKKGTEFYKRLIALEKVLGRDSL